MEGLTAEGRIKCNCEICFDRKFVLTTTNLTSTLQSGECAGITSFPCKHCNKAEYDEWLSNPEAFWERKEKEDIPRKEFCKRVVNGHEPTDEEFIEIYGSLEHQERIMENLRFSRGLYIVDDG